VHARRRVAARRGVDAEHLVERGVPRAQFVQARQPDRAAQRRARHSGRRESLIVEREPADQVRARRMAHHEQALAVEPVFGRMRMQPRERATAVRDHGRGLGERMQLRVDAGARDAVLGECARQRGACAFLPPVQKPPCTNITSGGFATPAGR
jgi:hypothetical protein